MRNCKVEVLPAVGPKTEGGTGRPAGERECAPTERASEREGGRGREMEEPLAAFSPSVRPSVRMNADSEENEGVSSPRL